MEVAGKTVIVTGGASGLGAAVVRSLAAAGGKVVIFDLNESRGNALAGEVGGFFIVCDVTSEQQVKDAIGTAIDKSGVPKVLVNCAGIGGSTRVVGKEGPMPLDHFEKIVRTNLIGSFNVLRLVSEQMIADREEGKENGVIISTASVAAFEGQIGQAAYSASKGGIVSMTIPIAREFAQFGIRVLALAPGLFETPLLEGLSDEAKQHIEASIPYPKRLGRPEEFASMVMQLVENEYMNGEVIRMDGALRMQPK